MIILSVPVTDAQLNALDSLAVVYGCARESVAAYLLAAGLGRWLERHGIGSELAEASEVERRLDAGAGS